MPAYLFVAVTYEDKACTEAYRRDVPALIAAHGGRYMAISHAAERLEGEEEMPHTIAILEFPTAAAAKAMLTSPEYQPYAQARQAGAKTTMYLLAG